MGSKTSSKRFALSNFKSIFSSPFCGFLLLSRKRAFVCARPRGAGRAARCLARTYVWEKFLQNFLQKVLDICSRKCYTVLVKRRREEEYSARTLSDPRIMIASACEVLLTITEQGADTKKIFKKFFKNPLTNSPRSAILKAQDKERVATYREKG